MNLSMLTRTFVLVLSFAFFVACGSSKPMVNGVDVSTSTVNGDMFLNISTELSIGNLRLPNSSFPIILPKDGREVGAVHLMNDSSGKNILKLEMNISDSVNLSLYSVKLPNGSFIPLIGENKVFKIPAGKLEIYLSLAQGAQAIAIAVPVSTFDAIGRKVGTTALMPMFNKNGIVGAAGVYTSKTKGLNGFALAIDLSSKIEDIYLPQALAQREEASLDYNDLVPSSRAERKINKDLYKLHRKRKLLRIKK